MTALQAKQNVEIYNKSSHLRMRNNILREIEETSKEGKTFIYLEATYHKKNILSKDDIKFFETLGYRVIPTVYEVFVPKGMELPNSYKGLTDQSFIISTDDYSKGIQYNIINGTISW